MQLLPSNFLIFQLLFEFSEPTLPRRMPKVFRVSSVSRHRSLINRFHARTIPWAGAVRFWQWQSWQKTENSMFLTSPAVFGQARPTSIHNPHQSATVTALGSGGRNSIGHARSGWTELECGGETNGADRHAVVGQPSFSQDSTISSFFSFLSFRFHRDGPGYHRS